MWLVLSVALMPMASGVEAASPSAASTVVTNAPDGSPLVTSLDRNHHPRETTAYHPDGSLRTRTVFERDAQGKVTRVLTYGHAKQVLRTETYQYAADGRLLEIRRGSLEGMAYNSWVSRYLPGDMPISFLKLCAKNAVSA